MALTQFLIRSADLMTRNLSRRVEAVAPVCDPVIQAELEAILRTYEQDNCSAWDMQPDGTYIRRLPAAGEARRDAQQTSSSAPPCHDHRRRAERRAGPTGPARTDSSLSGTNPADVDQGRRLLVGSRFADDGAAVGVVSVYGW